MGTLTSNDESSSLLAEAQKSGVLQVPQSVSSSSDATTPGTPSEVPGINSIPASVPQQEKPWVPSGGRKLDTGLSIVLENVASGFQRPSVLDVKLGSRLWADDAPATKRAKLDTVSKETTSHSLGFRIAGMKVWVGDNGKSQTFAKELGGQEKTDTGAAGEEEAEGHVTEKDGYKRYDKWYGRSFNDQNVKDGFLEFLGGTRTGKTDHSRLVAKRLAGEIQRIQTALEAEESRMYSASILIIYEGDPEAFEQALEDEKTREKAEAEDDFEDLQDGVADSNGMMEVVDLQASGGDMGEASLTVDLESVPTNIEDILDDEDEPSKVHDVRLIDFAHASWTPGQGPDENVLHGLRSLRRIMEELAEA